MLSKYTVSGSSRKHTSDDRDFRAIFGDETGSVTTRREHKNGTRILLGSGSDGSDGHRLRSLCGTGLEISKFIIQGRVADGILRKKTCLSHHEHRLDGVGAFRGFSRQHDAVSAIQNSICNVADFCAGGPRVILSIIS